jgi:hypothetical protein
MLDRLATFARRYSQETLWLHGANDSLYSAEVTRAFFDAYCKQGGRGRYVFIDDHPLPDGHTILRLSALWRRHVDDHLQAAGFAVAISEPQSA